MTQRKDKYKNGMIIKTLHNSTVDGELAYLAIKQK